MMTLFMNFESGFYFSQLLILYRTLTIVFEVFRQVTLDSEMTQV